MFLRLMHVCFILFTFAQVKSSPHIGSNQQDSTVRPSMLGDLFRAKARFLDQVNTHIHQKMTYGSRAISNNLNDLGHSISTSIDATGRLIDSGIAAGKQYGRTVFNSAIVVPKTIHDLVSACEKRNAYIDVNAADTLSYVDGQPSYLFQFVDETGHIIPVTAEVATTLVPGLFV